MSKLRILSGKYKGRAIVMPKGDQTRPSMSQIRAAFFNILNQEMEDSRGLDLFAGTGAIGFEALSQGARRVFAVESHPSAITAIRTSQNTLGLKEAYRLLTQDIKKALSHLSKKEETFDWIYADPPYGWLGGAEGIEWILKGAQELLSAQGRLFVETDRSSWNPKFEESGYFDSLEYIRTKQYGDTYLHEFALA